MALLFSYFFYAWGAPQFIIVLFFSSLIDYFLSLKMYESDNKNKKLLLSISLIINIMLLVYFKYVNFFIEEMNVFLGILKINGIHWSKIALPIGISFFTFQKISYVIDVYRKTTRPAKSFLNYALYVALFPQLIAGPIVRYYDVSHMIEKRDHNSNTFFEGMWRFSLGLSKKVLIANCMGKTADYIFSMNLEEMPVCISWLGALSYTFQIYFDFAGYSDMAIGLGKMMGLHFLENFNMPYIARNFTEFWTRWHISLSGWMKNYLYIPLGGSRGSKYQTIQNLWIVFLFSGFWHGASWNFIFWGGYHGFFLSINKYFKDTRIRLPKFCGIFLTFILLMIGWVFFRASTLKDALNYIIKMFQISTIGKIEMNILREEVITNRGIFILIVAIVFSFLPAFSIWEKIDIYCQRFKTKHYRFLVMFLLMILSISNLSNDTFNPFIYFRF